MKSNPLRSVRGKFYFISIASIVCSALAIVVLQTLLIRVVGIDAAQAARMEERYAFYYFLLFLFLATLFFFVFSRRMLANLESIQRAVDSIKLGDLDVAVPVQASDEIGRLAQNVRELAQNLKELREKETRSEKTKNEMIANISHDLRTPVTSLIGYLEMVQSSLGRDPAACQRYLEISQRKCSELKQLINELLEYSQLNFQEVSLKKEVIQVKEIVQQVMIDFVPQLEKEGLDFAIQALAGDVAIEADARLLVRLLQNVIGNALFYGRQGKRIDVRIAAQGSQARIEIINYGEPIAESDQPFIFERFYRGEKSRSAHSGGRGMGLSIAKSIAEMHGGQIECSSQAAQTVFTIVLPVFAKHSPTTQAAVS